MEVGWVVSKRLDGKTSNVTGLRVRGSGPPKVWTWSFLPVLQEGLQGDLMT